MSIFDSLGKRPKIPKRYTDPMQAMDDIQRNPSEFLEMMGLDVPKGMNDPEQLAMHLVNSGQRSNFLLQMAMQMMGMR